MPPPSLHASVQRAAGSVCTDLLLPGLFFPCHFCPNINSPVLCEGCTAAFPSAQAGLGEHTRQTQGLGWFGVCQSEHSRKRNPGFSAGGLGWKPPGLHVFPPSLQHAGLRRGAEQEFLHLSACQILCKWVSGIMSKICVHHTFCV